MRNCPDSVLLPNSRNQELEADRFGVIFAAMLLQSEEAVSVLEIGCKPLKAALRRCMP
jgi:Zn-dependent protease with chaperone function